MKTLIEIQKENDELRSLNIESTQRCSVYAVIIYQIAEALLSVRENTASEDWSEELQDLVDEALGAYEELMK